MKPLALNSVLVAFALPLLGCDSVSPVVPEETQADAMQDTTTEDTTEPTLLSTTPTDGDTGQSDDVEVVLVFSEAMNQGSVESSLQVELGGAISMSWNGVGDTLTIAPDAPLLYATGTGAPADTDANSYGVLVGRGSQDLAGNLLGDDLSLEFTTLKSMATTAALIEDMSRVVTPDGFFGDVDGPFFMGDIMGNVTDSPIRFGMTFDLSQIPVEATSVSSATLSGRRTIGATGTPFLDLGVAMIDHVSFGDTPNFIYNSSQSAHSTVGVFFIQGQIVLEVDVSSQVDDDLSSRVERGDLSQFLGRFEIQSDQKNDTDRVRIRRNGMELDIKYLHP